VRMAPIRGSRGKYVYGKKPGGVNVRLVGFGSLDGKGIRDGRVGVLGEIKFVSKKMKPKVSCG